MKTDFSIGRRALLGAAAAGMVTSFLRKGAYAQEDGIPTLARASRDAWLFGLPLIENAQSRAHLLRNLPPNTFLHKRSLVDWRDRFITTPNNDTLYSLAWLDLSAGPVHLEIPATGNRYVSVALMDMYTNNFAIPGTRTTGPDGGQFTIIGPDAALGSPLDIRSPTRWVCALVRLLVDGPQDLPAVHQIQDRFVLRGPAISHSGKPSEFAARTAPWDQYFASVQALMIENAPRATDERYLHAIAPLGIGLQDRFDPSRFPAGQVDEIRHGIQLAVQALHDTRSLGPVRQGWNYPRADLGDFHESYLYRAQVAIGGLYALPPQEALYIRPVLTPEQEALPAGRSLLLRFPAGQLPPVGAFWSLSMYERTPDGQFFFFRNDIDRYAIGNRTSGLVHGSDGGLDIWISREKPAGDRLANWLPAPARGPFGLFLRAYFPDISLISGTYLLPPLQLA